MIAIIIPPIKNIKIISRYLSIIQLEHKIIYFFNNQKDNWLVMIKILEIIGFILIGGTVYSFLGMMGNELRWPVFWSCAAGALAIILFRKWSKKKS